MCTRTPSFKINCARNDYVIWAKIKKSLLISCHCIFIGFWVFADFRVQLQKVLSQLQEEPSIQLGPIGSFPDVFVELEAQSNIVPREIHSINLNPSCPYQLAFHLDDGWSSYLHVSCLIFFTCQAIYMYHVSFFHIVLWI